MLFYPAAAQQAVDFVLGVANLRAQSPDPLLNTMPGTYTPAIPNDMYFQGPVKPTPVSRPVSWPGTPVDSYGQASAAAAPAATSPAGMNGGYAAPANSNAPKSGVTVWDPNPGNQSVPGSPQAQYPQSSDPQSQYPQTSYPQTQYPQTQYPQTQYPQTSYPPATGFSGKRNHGEWRSGWRDKCRRCGVWRCHESGCKSRFRANYGYAGRGKCAIGCCGNSAERCFGCLGTAAGSSIADPGIAARADGPIATRRVGNAAGFSA